MDVVVVDAVGCSGGQRKARPSPAAATSSIISATMVPPVSAGEFTIEFFEDDDGRSPVEEWMDSDLTDLELAALLSGLEHG